MGKTRETDVGRPPALLHLGRRSGVAMGGGGAGAGDGVGAGPWDAGVGGDAGGLMPRELQ
jgi:hypothetical protein